MDFSSQLHMARYNYRQAIRIFQRQSIPLELLHMVTIQDLTPQGMSPIVAPEKTESGMKPIEPTGKINDAGSDFTSIQTGRHDPAN